MNEQDQAEVERRLEAGEWLGVGDLMVLFWKPGRPKTRSAVDRWITKGARFGDKRVKIHFTYEPSGERICDPRDIAVVLAETRKIRSFEHPDGIPDDYPYTPPETP